MKPSIKFQLLVYKMVHDPVFDLPIQNKDFLKQGDIKFTFKIKHNANGTTTIF